MANSWYSYLGTDLDPLTAANYRKMTVDPLCFNGIGICSVYLRGETSDSPSTGFSPNLLTYIANALSTLTPQPNGVAVKHFVYLKGS